MTTSVNSHGGACCKLDYLGYRNDGKLEIMRVFVETRNY